MSLNYQIQSVVYHLTESLALCYENGAWELRYNTGSKVGIPPEIGRALQRKAEEPHWKPRAVPMKETTMKTRLFNEDERYTHKACELQERATRLLSPLFKEAIQQGYAVRDIETVLTEVVSDISLVERL